MKKKPAPDWEEIKAASKKSSSAKKKLPKVDDIVPVAAKSPRQTVVNGATQGRKPFTGTTRLDYVDPRMQRIGVGPEVKRRAS